MKKTNKKGFTIVELVIVIAVIAILAAVLIPTFSGVIEAANENAAMQAARNEYTEYLAAKTEHVVRGGDYVITSGSYAFVVEDGSFVSTGYKGTSSASANVQAKNGDAAAATIATWDGTTLTGSGATVTAVTDYDETAGIVIYLVTYGG